jgi:hypothetical protein
MNEEIFQKALQGASKWELQQIEGLALARKKIPSWAETEGIQWPVRLSMEQCSSEQTARYKASLLQKLPPEDRALLVDATGGFGVDFAFMAPLFQKAVYIEQNAELCRLVQHNLSLLGLSHVTCVEGQAEQVLMSQIPDEGSDICCFIDPARRDAHNRKMVGLRDCTPDVSALVPELLKRGVRVILKLSPMLDVTAALRELSGEWAVYVVAVDGECKELLLLSHASGVHAVDISRTGVSDFHPQADSESKKAYARQLSRYLYEPSAAILKAGLQDALPGEKLSPQSHLFTSDNVLTDFPGRSFKVERVSGFSKKELKEMTEGLHRANLTVRGFPMSVAQLRKKLCLEEGGDVYLFAATMADRSHVLIKCSKI